MTEFTMTNFLTLQPSALVDCQQWLNTTKQRIVSVRLRMALVASCDFAIWQQAVARLPVILWAGTEIQMEAKWLVGVGYVDEKQPPSTLLIMKLLAHIRRGLDAYLVYK